MKDFVLLHEVDTVATQGLPLLLRPCLFDYAETFNNGSTILHMEGGKTYNIVESPDKIYELLEE